MYSLDVVYKIKGSYSSEYILIENRQTGGGWNRFLPPGGLLVWRVGNSGYTVDLIEAVSRPASQGADDTDPFPGSGNVRSLSDFTSSSNCRFISGANSNVVIQNISNNGTTMTADLSPYWYGSIGQSQTWSGSVLVGENLTVASGITLTVDGGTSVVCTNGSAVLVNGSLHAVGTRSNPITFDFTAPNSTTGNGLVFNPGSNGTVQCCTIRNAFRGVYGNTVLPWILGCEITNNSYGIYLNNTGVPVNNPQIDSTNVTYNYADGMFLYNSSPTVVTGCSFSYNAGRGIYCVTGSTPCITNSALSNNGSDGINCQSTSPARLSNLYGDPGHNVVRNNSSNGVLASSSNVYMGNSMHPGLNSVTGNHSICLISVSASHVSAEYNYWVPYQYHPTFYTDGTSTIDASNPLASDPNPGRQASPAVGPSLASVAGRSFDPVMTSVPAASGGGNSFFQGDSAFRDTDLDAALNSLIEGKFGAAITKYFTKFENESDTEKRMYELDQLASCYRLGRKSGFDEFIKQCVFPGLSEKEPLYGKALELESICFISQKRFQDAIRNYETLIEDFSSDSAVNRNALFNIGYLYRVELNDSVKARLYWGELKKKYPTDGMAFLAGVLLGDFVPTAYSTNEGQDLPGNGEEKQHSEQDSTDAVPSTFEIGNYPNPFNPTTTIVYHLPKTGHVTLKVYDIVGREIKTLVDGYQEAGVHFIEFDGFGLASGVYFYRFAVLGRNEVKKMLLVK